MQTWYNAFKCFLINFMKRGCQLENEYMKLLLETVMCIMHCRKYHLHNCNRDSHLYNYNKNCYPHICSETVTCICAAETSYCIIATETVICIIVTERSTNIPVSTTSKPAKMQQTLSLA